MVAAQDLSSIPTCAIPCFAAAVAGSGCGLSDTVCQCTTGNEKITQSITECAPDRCSADDLAKIAPAAAGLCAAAGVSISASAASVIASSTAGVASGTASMAATTSAYAMSSGMPSASMTMTPSGSAPAEVSTAAAAHNIVGYGAVAMGVAGIFAF